MSREALEEVVCALGRAINVQARDWHDDDYLHIYLGSNRLANNFNSTLVRVGDGRQTEGPVRHLVEQVTAMLNSNEEFAVDDSFNSRFDLCSSTPREWSSQTRHHGLCRHGQTQIELYQHCQ